MTSFNLLLGSVKNKCHGGWIGGSVGGWVVDETNLNNLDQLYGEFLNLSTNKYFIQYF